MQATHNEPTLHANEFGSALRPRRRARRAERLAGDPPLFAVATPGA
jgi:hypothetical protein